MNVRNRLDKLEGKSGIRINVAESLMDLKRRAETGEKIGHTPDELRQLIAGCQDEKLKEIYEAALRAKCS